MKAPKSLLGFGILAVMAALLLVAAGCSEEDNPVDAEETFALPPESTFVIDFSDFDGASQLAKIAASTTKENWGFAAFNVAAWNTILTVTLAVPVASFVEAFKHEAVMQPDGSWQWSYNFNAGGIHTAVLNGKLVEGQVRWMMYISKQDEYTDFLWYTGICNLARTEGQWTLNYPPADPTPFIRIDWHRNVGEGTADIKYTNIIPEGAENGGYIFYGLDNAAAYDRFYDIYNKGADNLTNIEWDYSTKDGHVRDEAHFGDTLWHCWDANLDDVDCQ